MDRFPSGMKVCECVELECRISSGPTSDVVKHQQVEVRFRSRFEESYRNVLNKEKSASMFLFKAIF